MWDLALQVVGVIHLAIAAGNLLLPRLFDYAGRGMPSWDPFLRQIYRVHAFYIVLVLALIGLLCLVFPADLARTPMGRAICAGLALFWGIRIGLQCGYYDRREMGRLWYVAWPFFAAIVAFTALFGACAAGWAR